jgi:SAM domain (Sterile alpha motif)
MSEVRSWLEAIGLAQYADVFEAKRVGEESVYHLNHDPAGPPHKVDAASPMRRRAGGGECNGWRDRELDQACDPRSLAWP